MAEFLCKVADGTGKVFLHVEPAESIAEARQKLSDRGLFVYNVRPRAGLLSPILGRPLRKQVQCFQDGDSRLDQSVELLVED